jgi:thiol-disulfide isomerase/thioredoxin
MNKIRVVLIVVCTTATAVLIAAAVRTAPDISVQTAQGDAVRLASFKGNVVLVDFWASWCVPCQASFPALDALYRELQPRGLDVLAINVDERRKDADLFLAAHPHTMPVFFDPKGESPKAFKVKGMPTSFLIDRAGVIRFTHTGYSADVAQRYREEISLLLSEH